MTSVHPHRDGLPATVLDAVAVIAAAGVMAAAIAAVDPIYGGKAAATLLLAVMIPLLVALASLAVAVVARGAPAALTGPGTRLAVDLVGMVLLIHSLRPDVAGHAALSGLLDGGQRLLSVSLPVPPDGPELGLAVGVVGLATGVATEAARRHVGRLLPIVPGIIVVAGALAVGAGGAVPAPWAASLFIAAAGLSVICSGLVQSWPTRAQPGGSPGDTSVTAPLGRLAAAGATVLIIAAILVPTGVHLPGAQARQPYVLRTAVQPPPQPLLGADPLAGFAAVHDGAASSVFTAGVTSADLRGTYWQTTALDGFDGSRWQPTGLFRLSGSTLPIPPRLSVPSATLRAQVTLYGPATYLPCPGTPVDTSLPAVEFDRSDGVVVPVGTPTSPLTYQVTAVVARPNEASLIDSSIPAGNANAGSPPTPPDLASLAQDLIRSAQPTPWDRILKLQSYFTGGTFSLDPPGHSTIGNGYYQISQLIQTHKGSAEQYAAAFAVLARAVGFHTRLALGYLHTAGSPSRELTYTTADYTVWPEVLLKGAGWEPIPVNPAAKQADGAAAAAAAIPPEGPVAAAIDRQRQLDHVPPPRSPESNHATPRIALSSHRGGLPTGLLAPVLAVGVVLIGLLVLLSTKGLRARRQRRPLDPALRLAGAWEHALDRLTEFGVPITGALTAHEVASRAVTDLGSQRATPVVWLVPFVDAARYDRRSSPTRAAADAAWAVIQQFDASLRANTPLGRRIQARLSVAPLRRPRSPRREDH